MSNSSAVLSVIATVKNRLPDLSIKDGQLIFVQDSSSIVLDYNGKRKFYNQIVELLTEQQRKDILAPIVGSFYFVIETAVLWNYQSSGWVQITTQPSDIVFVGTSLPQLGSGKQIYVDTLNNDIKIWDNEKNIYQIVSDKTNEISEAEIASLFNHK